MCSFWDDEASFSYNCLSSELLQFYYHCPVPLADIHLKWVAMAEQDICPHLDSIGEVTKDDLLQKSKVGFHLFTINVLHDVKDTVGHWQWVPWPTHLLQLFYNWCSNLGYISPHCYNNQKEVEYMKALLYCLFIKFKTSFLYSCTSSCCREPASHVAQGVQTCGPVCR